MERGFGHDFSAVRVHIGEAAGRSARALGAVAYTLGSDVVFSSGRYAPYTVRGRRLLAHELAHVVQQTAGDAAVVQRQTQDGVEPAGIGAAFPSCDVTPPMPDDRPPPLDRWLENATLEQIRAEEPGENRVLLSRARGSRGEAVQLVQQAILSIGCDERDQNLLPRFGADGIFGSETHRAVEVFQEGRTIRDGIVGPLTLAELDALIIPPAQTRRGDETGEDKEVKAPPSKPISAHALKSSIKSVSMPLPKGVRVVRLAGDGDKVHQTLNRPFEVSATIELKPGASLSGARFGFFQLGRAFETWRVTYRDVEAKAGSKKADLNRDETFPLRNQLPARDHVGTFYPLPSGKQPAPIGASTTKLSVDFRDRPGNLYDQFFLDIPSRAFSLSGIHTESFFFTALGLVTASGQPLLLKTFFWTVRHCEDIGPNLSRTVHGAPVAVKGPFDCLQGSCNENEPGASTFGSSGGKSFGAIVNDTLPTYGGGNANKPPAGPDDFKVPCAR